MSRSDRLLERASRVLPGGVSCAAHAFPEVGGDPPYIARAEGCYLVDEEGHRYLDLLGAWGALVFGHSPAVVQAAVAEALAHGAVFGAACAVEVELAELLCERVDALGKVRFCESGLDAEHKVLDLARFATDREAVLRFDGQGWSAPYNDTDGAAEALASRPAAAVLVEPVSTTTGLLLPEPGFLEALRDLAARHGALLVFDERATAFRLGQGGAAARYGVTPDLVLLGGVLGGGLPLAAFGGRADLMDLLAPIGPLRQPGRQGGNPAAMAGSLATLRALGPEVHARLEEIGAALQDLLAGALDYHGWSMSRLGSMFTIWSRERPPRDAAEARSCDPQVFRHFHRAALGGGVYLPPSQQETAFLSALLGQKQIEAAADALTAAIVSAAT